jgi:hypothetical protein
VTRVVALLVALATTAPARAEPEPADVIGYRVRKGDTLELVGAEFYGDRADAIFIVVANKLQHPRPLVPGEKLRIPRNREFVTRPGDTWTSLARDLLGDERRASFLAAFNDVGDSVAPPPSEALTAGTQIEVPLTIIYEPAGPETLAQISATYFGDAKYADLLKRYNFLDQGTVDKGDKLTVPVVHVKIRAQKLPAADNDSVQRHDRQRQASQAAPGAIQRARDAWADGDFNKVIDTLAQDTLDLDYLDLADAIEVGVLLGEAYCGSGLEAQALQSFQKVLRRKPDHALNSFSESPKVRALWLKAGGKVDE